VKFWETDDFKAQQKAWYRRLKDEGFNDAEELIGSELMLKQQAKWRMNEGNYITRCKKLEYFLVLGQHLLHAVYRNEIDKLIMTWHADGKTIKFMCEELKLRGSPRCRHSIRFIIRKYEMIWGMRVYTPKQLNHQKV
jgi:hypothetical protein